MSEAMSSGEIEDVLSSIRRLVTEDLRPMPRTKSAAEGRAASAEPAISGGGQKLILTSALRVVPGPEDDTWSQNGAGPQAKAAAEPEPAAAEPEPAVTEPESARAEPEQPETQAAEEDPWANDDFLPEDAQDEELVPLNFQTAEFSLSKIDELHGEGEAETAETAFATEAGPDDAIAPQEDADAQMDAASSRISGLFSVIGAGSKAKKDEDWEPEAGDVSFSDVSWRDPEWVEEAEVVEETDNDAVAAEAAASGAESTATKVEQAATQVEQAPRLTVSPAARTETWSDRAEAEAVSEINAAEAQNDDSDDEADMAQGIFAEETDGLDEALLRDLVRELIREELGGTLGERITRNVRKLVRAEINRALTARDFD